MQRVELARRQDEVTPVRDAVDSLREIFERGARALAARVPQRTAERVTVGGLDERRFAGRRDGRQVEVELTRYPFHRAVQLAGARTERRAPQRRTLARGRAVDEHLARRAELRQRRRALDDQDRVESRREPRHARGHRRVELGFVGVDQQGAPRQGRLALPAAPQLAELARLAGQRRGANLAKQPALALADRRRDGALRVGAAPDERQQRPLPDFANQLELAREPADDRPLRWSEPALAVVVADHAVEARIEVVDFEQVVHDALVDREPPGDERGARLDVEQPPVAQRPARRQRAPVRLVEVARRERKACARARRIAVRGRAGRRERGVEVDRGTEAEQVALEARESEQVRECGQRRPLAGRAPRAVAVGAACEPLREWRVAFGDAGQGQAGHDCTVTVGPM